ncbi:MAG: protease inhibitor I42 family protein [Bacteroidales bacterium]|nr:protease inhibitor I42 family protein [Bacteroidales bacterium]
MKTIILSGLFLLSFPGYEKHDNRIDYIVSVGEVFTVELEANWTTGYSWQWENKSRVTIADTLRREYMKTSDRLGSQGKEVWTFVGKKKGKATLTFLYKRPFETGYVEKKEFRIKVK